MFPDPTGREGLKMARYLSAISMFARGIGILGVAGSVIGILVALSMRRSDDQLGFSLISLGVMLIAVVVWSTGTFHGTMAKMAPVLVSIDQKLEETLARERQRALAPAPTPPAPATAPAPLEDNAFLAGPEVAAPASAPDTEPAAPPESVPRVRVPEPKPEPERMPCPSCGGLIHPEATRCVHCMKRVARG